MTPSKPALQLARRLAALPEPVMRERVLIEFVKRRQGELSQVVRILDEIYRLGREGGPPFNIALLTVAATLSGKIDYELMAALYEEAKRAELDTVTQLLLSGMPSQVSFTRRDEQQELTLGHRKWMARLSDRNALERLLANPEPEVIHNLLDNPRITEQDVVLLAARRPAFAEVQLEIFNSRRWIPRYAVKRALVLNPYTPTDISLRLVGFIKLQDLRLIGSSPSLPEALRGAAKQLEEKTDVPKDDGAC
jgi:hypothetical protein